MIHILHIGLSDSIGGIESFLLRVSRKIDSSAFHFDYVALCEGAAMVNIFEAMGSHVYVLSNRQNPFMYAQELIEFMGQGYDIVHIHKNSAADTMPFKCARRIPNLHVVAHAHNTAPSVGKLSKAASLLGRSTIVSSSNTLLTCSQAAGQWLYGKKAMKEDNVMVIPNGIDIDEFRFNPTKRSSVRNYLHIDDKLVIGCVGRFTPQKNQIFLAGILEQLVSHGKDAVILFLGDGILRMHVAAEFSKRELSDRVIFQGVVPNVADFMQAMDVLAMPSLFEGLPIVAVEAQASGLPCLLSDSITHEVDLTDTVIRLRVAKGAEAAWSDAIAHSSKIPRSARSRKPSARLISHDASSVASHLEKIYQEVCP